MLSYILLNYNDNETTQKCVDKIKDYTIIEHIIIVDNMSTDDSYYRLKKLQSSKVDVIKTDKNGGYGYGNNFGIRYAKKKYNSELVVISNPDVFIDEYCVVRCVEFITKKEDCSIVSLLMQNLDGSYNYKCVWKLPTYWQYLFFSSLLGSNINFNYDEKNFEKEYFVCDCVAGSWLMAKTNDLINMGLYDENVFLYCEETILAHRAKKLNYKTYVLPKGKFLHMHSVSISKTFKSDITQQRLMWKSRLYVLDTYYRSSRVQKIIGHVFAKYALLERRLINFVRLIKRSVGK